MHLLVLSCSARKRSVPENPLPALDRYDGQFFRILRKSGVCSTNHLHVVILSARFGFLTATSRIPWYDQKITPDQAIRLRPQVEDGFQKLSETPWDSIFVNLGQTYAPLVVGIAILETAAWATGPIGKRSRQLTAWLSRLKTQIAENT